MQQSATRQRQQTPYIARYLLAPAAFFHPSFIRINNLRPPNLTISCCCCFTVSLCPLNAPSSGRFYRDDVHSGHPYNSCTLHIHTRIYVFYFVPHTLFICLWYCIRVLHTIRVHNEYIVYIQRSLH